uniref:Myb-like domain-containing protein n=1 Tax=Echeneis naucrates TaxID=173247 RepID=A0A665TW53_ECHNA
MTHTRTCSLLTSDASGGCGGGQRSCFCAMNPVCKRLRLSLPTPQSAPPSTHSLRSPLSSPQLLCHDALLPPPALAHARGKADEEEGYLLVEEDTTDSSLVITMEDSQMEVKAARRRALRKRRGKQTEEEEEPRDGASESDEEEASVGVEIDRQLDQSLESKSKQHNLTTVNVRNIIHEVITNEHVVAMMKAAINETEAIPPFEPKMTRSRFKEVVEKGVVIPAWNISPIKKNCDAMKAPQFVDIPLAEEDSSDEEYRPDEEEEDETAEDTFQESDLESTASSPRGSRLVRPEDDSCSPWQSYRSRSRISKTEFVSMGPPPPPKAPLPTAVTDSSFLEKLHAVEEELAVCMEPYQPLSQSEDEVGLMAYRTRSKRPLRDVPLGRLEAELRAPDITPDMYDSSSTHEDREWTDWLRGLMSSDVDNEEECDDEDDPEYNFLADIDEPDLEDYRDDKAVRITKKEVNELMEELFETLKDDLAAQEVDDEGHEEEEEPQEEINPVQTQATEEHNIDLGGGGDDDDENRPITELRTVKQQLAFIRKRQHTYTICDTHTTSAEPDTLKLDRQQKIRLQQQIQQHVQLLTQIHLLTSPVIRLQSEAETTRQFLVELDILASRSELLVSPALPGFRSIFRSSNLQAALQLLDELRHAPIKYMPRPHRPDARGHMRCHPVLPAELAWIFSTRPVFVHPELLPRVSLDPDLFCPRRTSVFTAAEDCLLVLGLRNMEGSCDPTKLVSQFLLRKTLVQIRRRILQCCRPGFPDNIVKAFRYQRVVWSMPVACRPVDPKDRRSPVEREESVLPLWLVRSLPVIYRAIKQQIMPTFPSPNRDVGPRQRQLAFLSSASKTWSFPPGTKYPPRVPQNLDFRRIGFVLLKQTLPPPPTDSSPIPDRQVDQTLDPPQLLRRLPVTSSDITTSSTVSMTITEQIRRHCLTLAGLRWRRPSSATLDTDKCPSKSGKAFTPPPEDHASYQVDDDVIRMNDEWIKEEEEESEILLALSESSSSTAGSLSHDDDLGNPERVESENEQEGAVTSSRAAYSDGDDGETSYNENVPPQEKLSLGGSEEEEDEDDQTEVDDMMFAQDYLHRVCEAVQVCPGLSEQVLQMLDQFSSVGSPGTWEGLDVLYDGLSSVLQPWPQLIRDFAGFLNRGQAHRCGLLLEQQMFEHSRQFLRQLERSLGDSSSLYQQVVLMLQGSPTPPSEDMDKIWSLLKHHPDLQDCFLQVYTHSPEVDSGPQTRNSDRKEVRLTQTGSDAEEESNRDKVITWTREADRVILTACQRGGANRKTFRHVSAHLGNRTAHQVSLRFHYLMTLFQSASEKSTSVSSEGQPISRQEAAPD